MWHCAVRFGNCFFAITDKIHCGIVQLCTQTWSLIPGYAWQNTLWHFKPRLGHWFLALLDEIHCELRLGHWFLALLDKIHWEIVYSDLVIDSLLCLKKYIVKLCTQTWSLIPCFTLRNTLWHCELRLGHWFIAMLEEIHCDIVYSDLVIDSLPCLTKYIVTLWTQPGSFPAMIDKIQCNIVNSDLAIDFFTMKYKKSLRHF